MEQKSQIKFLPWPEFEPRTSLLAIQNANPWITVRSHDAC